MEIDSVHFYVADAKNISNWFIDYLDFKKVDLYQDRESLTVTIAKKSILFVISSPINDCSNVARYLNFRAEGIVDITFRVDRLQPIIHNAKSRGIKVLQSIQTQGKIKYACVAGWDCLQHTIIESEGPSNCYLLPNGKLRNFRVNTQFTKDRFTFTAIDHIVLNVAKGKLAQTVTYYQSLFNFQIQQTFQIQTKQSGLYSQALIDSTGKVQFNINEPTTANSQIQEFIELNSGAGIQHLALKSANLIQDMARMRAYQKPDNLRTAKLENKRSQGVVFLPIPLAYYNQLKQKLKRDSINFSPQELQSISEQGILIDWQQNNSASLLMQIFTRPIFQQPTFFLEFIERRQQATGFGEGNFKALFKAVEYSQNRNSQIRKLTF